jgi:hypothetical protein
MAINCAVAVVDAEGMMSRVYVFGVVYFPLPKGQPKRGEATAVPIRVHLLFAMSAVDPWGDFEVKSPFLPSYLI